MNAIHGCILAVSIIASLLALPVFATAADKPDWTYDEDYTGQEGWSSIKEEYAICEDGTNQSPIQIGQTVIKKMPALKPALGIVTATVKYADHTLEVKPSDKHKLVVDGTTYVLDAIRFHYPSEHMIGLVYYLGEIRLMYVSAKGKHLHLAVFVNIGKENNAIDPIIDGFVNGGKLISFNLADLLPKQQGYYSYSGSLTTPPCTENVEWRIFKNPIDISSKQSEKLNKIYGRNTRLPQPIYFRTVYETPN